MCIIRSGSEYVSRDGGRGPLQWKQGLPHPDTESHQAKVESKSSVSVGVSLLGD